MIARLLKSYNQGPLSSRIISAFLYGAMFGLFIWGIEYEFNLPLTLSETTAFWLEPLGIILIGLLKLLIVPYVFFTLARAASRLSSDSFVRVTWRMIFWFIVTSLIAALVGTVAALIIGPGKGSMSLDIRALPVQYASELRGLSKLIPDNPTLSALLMNVFSSPLAGAYAGGYLALAIFGVFFGLAMNSSGNGRISAFVDEICNILRKVNDWISNYAPFGVFALSVAAFARYGKLIFSEYVFVVAALAVSVLVMFYVIYPLVLLLFGGINPMKVIPRLHQTALTAFVIGNPGLVLPMAVDVAEKRLGVRRRVAEFTLPFGLMLNLDGICLAVPFVAVMAANVAGVEIDWWGIYIISIGAGLASFFCLTKNCMLVIFTLILSVMNLPVDAVAAVIALTCGLGPVIRMLSSTLTMTGNMVCTCIVANKTGNMEIPDK